MKLLKILFLFSLINQISLAQDLQWKELSGLPGCFQLREGANGKLFAVSSIYIYESTNDGLSWSPTTLPLAYMNELAVHDQILIAGVSMNVNFYNQAFLSTDNGGSWNRIYAARGGFSNYMVSNASVIYGTNNMADEGYKIVRYMNQKWDTIGTMIPRVATILNWALIDHSDNFLIEGGNGYGGIIISTDFGGSWHTYFAGRSASAACIDTKNQMIVGISQSAAENFDGGVYISSNHGTTWDELGLKDKSINSITSDSTGNIYVATTIGIYGYRIVTKSWEYLGPSVTSLVDVRVLTSGSILSTTYNFFGFGVLYRSIDNGVFWSPSSAAGFAIFSLTTTPSGYILAGTLGDRIARSMNGGVSWQQLPPGTISEYVYAFASNDSQMFACTDEGLYSSTDEGANWKILTSKYFSGSVYSAVVQSSGKIIAGTNFGIYTSTDEGSTWIRSGLTASKVLFMAHSPSGIVYSATDNDGVFSSSDDGTTWQSCGLIRNDIQTIAVNDVGDIYVGVYGGIFRSTDGGTTWAQSVFTNTYVYSIAFNALQDVFAGTYVGLFRLSRGQSWTRIGFVGQPVLSLAFNQQRNLLVGLYKGGIYRSVQSLTGVDFIPGELPTATRLEQNYPNPFNPTTNFQFTIANTQLTSLKVYDILGREVTTLLNEVKQPGRYSVTWDASGFSSGIYYYKLQSGSYTEIKKMVLIR